MHNIHWDDDADANVYGLPKQMTGLDATIYKKPNNTKVGLTNLYIFVDLL